MLGTGGEVLRAGPRVARVAPAAALMLLPGALVVYFAFNAGGFFPGSQALVAVVLALLVAAGILLDGHRTLTRNIPLWTVTLGFCGYAGWVLLSVTWSHAPLRATSEFDLTLLYVFALVLYGTCVSSPRRLRWLVRGLALGAFAVCVVALLSRALPSLWPIPTILDTPRLQYPVTYWNTLGLLAVIGSILCLGISSSDQELPLSKALGALAVPVFAATLLLTFSRGAIAAGIVAIVAYVVLARARSMLGALLSIVPPAAIAFRAAYQAGALAHPLANNPSAVAQGRHLATVVAVCSIAAACLRILLLRLDRRLIAIRWRSAIRWRERRLIACAAAVVACAAALAAGLPHQLYRQYDTFVQGNAFPVYAQARDRLTATGANGRIDVWRVAVHQFDAAPLHGSGAGTFELAWELGRPRFVPVVNAHSLYVENLGNLGIVGLGLLVCVLMTSLVVLARRLRGPDRALYAAALAVLLAWLVRAGVDWDWQMPVVSLPVFVLAGAAFARAAPESTRSPRPVTRVPLAAGVLGIALIPAFASVSQSHLQYALVAYESDDCATATREAHTSLNPLSFRPDAHEILAFCEAAAGERAAARRDMKLAVAEDPDNWETHYGLSIVLAATGGDPRAEIARAVALDPHNELPIAAAGFFRYDLRRYWAQEAALDLLRVGGQGDRSIAALRPRKRG